MPINQEAFFPVLAWLEAGAPHNDDLVFNMNYVRAPDTYAWDGGSCGTACCIAGALEQFNDLGVLERAEHGVHNCRLIGQAVGMNIEQVNDLFLAGNRPSGLHDPISPHEAATAIRSMLETGEVQWPNRP